MTSAEKGRCMVPGELIEMRFDLPWRTKKAFSIEVAMELRSEETADICWPRESDEDMPQMEDLSVP